MDADEIRRDFEAQLQAWVDDQPVIGDPSEFDGPGFCDRLRRLGIPVATAVIEGDCIAFTYAVPRGVG